jgi:hypothetical protein
LIYFNQSTANAGATLFGTRQSSSQATLQFEMENCVLFDSDPVFGPCMEILFLYNPILEVTNFIESTGNLTPKKDKVVLTLGSNQSINVDRNQYVTNNQYLGYVANIFNY